MRTPTAALASEGHSGEIARAIQRRVATCSLSAKMIVLANYFCQLAFHGSISFLELDKMLAAS